MPEASVPQGYCAWVFAEGLTSPRGMVADDAGQLVVIESGSAGAVTLLWDANGDRINQPSERLRIASTSGLNHGVALQGGYLYASTATTIYRWPYTGARAALSNRQTVLAGMPNGGHSTRTLVFDSAGNLYVSIGSGSNLDPDSSRARILRIDAEKLGGATLALSDASVFADGLRNEVGLRFDASGRLFGVENGSDNLQRSDLGWGHSQRQSRRRAQPFRHAWSLLRISLLLQRRESPELGRTRSRHSMGLPFRDERRHAHGRVVSKYDQRKAPRRNHAGPLRSPRYPVLSRERLPE
ncbi:MAG: PQQ-dependent sugar dehydrogenase [Polyangiaceae bacterium]